jgi:flagellar hook-length control protein FliK
MPSSDGQPFVASELSVAGNSRSSAAGSQAAADLPPIAAAPVGAPATVPPQALLVTGLGTAVADPVSSPVEATGGPPMSAPDPELPDRLVQSMRMQAIRGGGDAIVQIRPEHLGPVTVAVRVENGIVSAHILAADPQVASWLQANQDLLREGLHSNGLTLDRLVVEEDGRNRERRDRRRDAPPRPRYEQREDRQSTFELTI